MAIQVEFEGWLNESKQFDWGTILKVSHDQRSKNQQTGEWETTGKDYIDVSASPELLAAVDGAKVIRVKGNLKVSTYTKNDGSTGVSLRVTAKELAPVKRGQDPVAVVREVLSPASEAPF